MNKQKLPLWTAFVLDFLLFAAFFGIFMLVHYVGSQMKGDAPIGGIGDEPPVATFTRPPTVSSSSPIISNSPGSDPTADPTGYLDVSGQFGASFPERFSSASEKLILTEDGEIRTFLNRQGFSFYDGNGDGVFVGLYQSHDVFVSVLQVDTVMNSLASGNPHAERYYVFDIYVRNIENLYAYATSTRDDLENLITAAGDELDFTDGLPIAAVNGDYWGNTNHCLIAERNGAILGSPNFDYILSDLCVLYYDGTMESLKPSGFSWSSVAAKNPYQIWNFGPGLMDGQGHSLGSYSNDSYDHNVVDARHPRTVLGYYEPGHYCFVTVDGRSDVSDGMTLPEVGLLMESLGCLQAYNMDGGDSTYCYFEGEILRQNWDRADDDNARKIYDIICVGEVK
ncbi:MAG: phosphodiester glycosidase family protein [Eubacteriales bacterium]